jgi:diaminopimelate epimerase
MNIAFYKYSGAGNDFVVLDNREEWFDWNNTKLIQKLCDRKFGVGADGILLLQNKEGYAFEMLYANSDGSRGSMCGNGGRCITAFAEKLGIINNNDEITFWGPDGEHKSIVRDAATVSLQMINVGKVEERNNLNFIHTGTDHHIQFVTHLELFPVCTEARKVRDTQSDPAGVNINYVEKQGDVWHVRTYERGVEDETLACGTGATAVALLLAHQEKITGSSCDIVMPGGTLSISFEKNDSGFKNIWLSGPADFVFEGIITID